MTQTNKQFYRDAGAFAFLCLVASGVLIYGSISLWDALVPHDVMKDWLTAWGIL